MKKLFFLPLLIITIAVSGTAPHSSDDIIGCWMSTENNLEVEVFKTGKEYKARIIWFDDRDDKNSPMNVRNDRKNPNKELRKRKVVGLEVMNGLIYNADTEEWQDGRIYDASTGKDWNVKALMTKDNYLKVRGYWHFQFLGQNMFFKKVS
jgi:uncharacterized protein (DUF2147 family)